MKHYLPLFVFLVLSCSCIAQRFYKKPSQIELIMNVNYNYSTGGGLVGIKHNYGSTNFYGKVALDISLPEKKYKGVMTSFVSYGIGFSLLKIINENFKLLPLDVSFGLGVGGGYETVGYQDDVLIYEKNDSKFLYGGKAEVEVEYVFSQRIGAFVNTSLLLLGNNAYARHLLPYLAVGVAIKF